MSKLSCEIPDALGRKLARAAKRRRVPKAAIVREILAAGLNKCAGTHQEQPFVSAYDLMKDGIGCFDSGLGDLSTNKKHLEGFGREKFRA